MARFDTMQNRVLDATLRGGDGNRTQIKEDINEAIKEVDALLRPTTKKSIETLVANQGDYSILTDFGITDCSSIRDITYVSVSDPTIVRSLEPASPEFVREQRQSFVFSTYINYWALEGIDTLLLYPVTQNTGDQITIYYTARPADLANETDVPVGLPQEFHDVYELAAIKRSMRQSSPEYAHMYYVMFETRLGDYRKWRNRRDGAVARRVNAGRPGRRLVPHDNSADWRY